MTTVCVLGNNERNWKQNARGLSFLLTNRKNKNKYSFGNDKMSALLELNS